MPNNEGALISEVRLITREYGMAFGGGYKIEGVVMSKT